MICPKCDSPETVSNGKSRAGLKQFKCKNCGKYFQENTAANSEPKRVSTAPLKIGISEAELRSKHDNLFICEMAVKTLEKGNYIPERDFLQMCKFRGSNYRQTLEHKSFDDYHGSAGGSTYWGHKDDIIRLKNEGILR